MSIKNKNETPCNSSAQECAKLAQALQDETPDAFKAGSNGDVISFQVGEFSGCFWRTKK